MKNTFSVEAEKIKSDIKETTKKSKETIREFIDANTNNINAAVDSNKKIFDSIKEKLDQQEIDDSVTDSLKQSFSRTIELAEDTLDSIINSYTKQLEMNVDFNVKLIDAIKESDVENPKKLLALIAENFEASRELTVNNTKEIFDFYNKHTNLALNFNRKFGDNIKAQMEIMFNIHSKSLHGFSDWAIGLWNQQNEKKN